MKALVVLSLLSLSGAARADRSTERLIAVAEDAFDHGFFGDALLAYRDAWERTRAPTLLLKIGQCQERLGAPEEAANAYRRFLLEETGLAEGERAELMSKIARLEARAVAAPPSPPPLALVAAPPPSPGRLVGLRRAVLVGAVASAATVLIAGAVTLAAADGFAQLNSDCRGGNAGCSGSARDRVAALNHSADALWAVAVVGAAATLTLHLILRHRSR